MALELTELGHNAQAALKNIIARANAVEDEKAECMSQLREIYAEAKAFGLDSKVVRKAVRLMRMDPAKREEERVTLELYLTAVLG